MNSIKEKSEVSSRSSGSLSGGENSSHCTSLQSHGEMEEGFHDTTRSFDSSSASSKSGE